MKAFSLRTRALLLVAACTFVSAAVVTACASVLLASLWLQDALLQVPGPVRAAIMRCEAGQAYSQELRTGPFDVKLLPTRDGRPDLPRLQPADRAFAQQLTAERRRRMVLSLPLGVNSRGALLSRPSSECGLVIYTVWASPLDRPQIALGLLLVFGATMAGALTLAYFLVVRPIVRRIRKARELALQIGSGVFPKLGSPAREEDWLDLALIVDALERADAQIQANEALLREREVVLKDHVAGVAHDLRTPLAALHLHLQAAQQSDHIERQREGLHRAMADAQFISLVLGNLESLAEARAKTLEFEPGHCDLVDIVERCVVRFGAFTQQTGNKIVVDCEERAVICSADPVLCDRLISNLVHNAVEHGEEAGIVLIRLSTAGSEFKLEIHNALPLAEKGGRSARTGRGIGLKLVRQMAVAAGMRFQFSLAVGAATAELSGPTV